MSKPAAKQHGDPVFASAEVAQGRPSRGAHGLLADCRGAILIPAVVIGALLVGALFYVAAVGDAILYRTMMQDAADSTAFESAVWHARGMNAIAVLNILMSLALAFFAVLRITEIVLLALAVVTGGATLSPLAKLVEGETTVHKAVNTALIILETTEKAVSMGVPYVAAYNAKKSPTAADTVWPVTMSLVPPQVDRLAQQPPRRPNNGIAALPIQDDEFETLCGKAVAFVPNQVREMLNRVAGRPPGPLGWAFDKIVDNLLEPLGGAGGGMFCQPVAGMAALAAEEVASAGEVCDDRQDRERQAAEAEGREHEAWTRAKREECEHNAAEEAGTEPESLSKAVTFDAKPAKMWEPAANGHVFMHAWSYAYGDPPVYARDRQGMEIAGHDRDRLDTSPQTRSVAEAEYYFDCGDVWHECEEDAVWAPGWTARMRRFRFPSEEFVRIAFDYPAYVLDSGQRAVTGDLLENGLAEVISRSTGLPDQGLISDFVVDTLMDIPIVHELTGAIDDAITQLRDEVGIDETLNQVLDPDRTHDERRIH